MGIFPCEVVVVDGARTVLGLSRPVATAELIQADMADRGARGTRSQTITGGMGSDEDSSIRPPHFCSGLLRDKH